MGFPTMTQSYGFRYQPIYGLLGVNGAGKSTTLRVIAGNGWSG